MKKKLASIVLTIALVLTSIMPAYAQSRLSTPVIDDIMAGKNCIKVDWGSVKGADEYKIYRATSSNGKFYYLDTTDISVYKDFSIAKGTRYYYKVRAISYGEKDDSKYSKWRSAKVNKPASTRSSSTSVSQTVYITATGSKYHRYGCQYLWNSCYAISLSNAKSAGYTACSRCW